MAGPSPHFMYAIRTSSAVVANLTGGGFTPGVCQSSIDEVPQRRRRGRSPTDRVSS